MEQAAKKDVIMRFIHLLTLLAWGGVVVLFSGCRTATAYQSPVTQFQTSINSANSGIRTYLLGVNDVIAKGTLYTEYSASDTPAWQTKDLANGIPDAEIQVRLQALATISAYANALEAIADSQDVANLQQAAKTLGANVNTLSATVKSINPADHGSIDLGDPVTALITLFGTIGIEHQQQAVLEKEIIAGSTNVDAIIDKLRADAKTFSVVIDVYEDQIWAGKLRNYNKEIKTASPQNVDALITQVVADYDSVQSLKSAPMDALLATMENAHQALVVFAKSSKTPKDLSDLAGQINIFAGQVQLFNNALSSIQLAINSTK